MPLNYDQTPTVAPQTVSPNDLISARASPEAFGSQVGQAVQRLGATGEEVGKEEFATAIQRQGVLNEAAVADAETKMNSAYGEIDGWYKSLKGQAAMAAHPEAVQRIQQVRQNILQGLPNGAAQRAFNIVAARAEGFVLRDYGNYRGTQEKEYVVQSNAGLRENLIDQSSRYDYATNPNQIGYLTGSVNDLNERLVAAQGWDLSTKEGQAILKQENDKTSGAIFTNVVKAIADDPDKGDVIAAHNYLIANKDSIPSVTYAKLTQELNPRYRDAMAKNGGAEILKGADDDYEKSISAPEKLEPIAKPETEQPLGRQEIHDKFRQQESGGTPSAQKTNPYQIQEDTFNRYKHPDERWDKISDRNQVAERILDGYTKQYNGDMSRVAVAYFSGPGNVAPVGSPTPYKQDVADKNGKTTSSYVQDITGGKQSAEGTATDQVYSPRAVPTKADFYERNRNTYIKKAEDWADQHFPNDPRMRENVVNYTERHMQDTIRSQTETNDANSNAVGRFVLGDGDPTHLITNTHQLETAPKEVRDGWHYLQWAEPFKARSIENIITANNRQKHAPLTYGTDFYKHFSDFTDRLNTTNPAKYSDYWDYVGADKNSPLTTTGQSVLGKEIEYAKKGPEQAAFVHAERDFLDRMHNKIGTDAIGNQKFSQFIQNVMPKIQAARTKGLTIGQLFDENDKTNYVGKDVGQYVRTLEQFKTDAIRQHLDASQFGLAPTTPAPKFDVKSLGSVSDAEEGVKKLKEAVSKGDLTSDQAVDYSVSRGWRQRRPVMPSIPSGQTRE